MHDAVRVLQAVYADELADAPGDNAPADPEERSDLVHIAHVGEAVAGCLLVHRRGSSEILHSLAVLDAFRFRGVATRLIRSAIADAQARRSTRLLVAAVKVNGVWDQRRYQQLGFTHIRRPPIGEFQILIQRIARP